MHNITPIARAMVPYGDATLHVVVLHETDGSHSAYVAHGLEKDCSAQGETIKSALDRLRFTAALDHETETSCSNVIAKSPDFVYEWYEEAAIDIF